MTAWAETSNVKIATSESRRETSSLKKTTQIETFRRDVKRERDKHMGRNH